MSEFAFNDLSNQVKSLSYEQSLMLMKILLQNFEKKNIEQKENWLSETFALMDSKPVSSVEKWSRAEIYER